MSPLVEFPLSSGGSVLIDVHRHQQADPQALRDGAPEQPPLDEPVTRGKLLDRAEQLPERAGQTFDSAIRTIRPAADALLLTLTQLSRVPDEIAVEFAVELSAQAGAFVATLGSTANFKISLTRRRPDPKSETAGHTDQQTYSTNRPVS